MPHNKDHFDKFSFKRVLNNISEEELKDKFRPRGSNAFSSSLSENAIQNSFTKEGDNRKYPYLSSRFLINPELDNFQENYADRGNLNSIREDKDKLQQSRARRGVFGNKKYLESLEEAAKISSKIGKNLSKALVESVQDKTSSGSEEAMSRAIFDAQAATRDKNNPWELRRGPIRDPRSGNYIDNDPSYQNAYMIDEYNTARRKAVDAQDAAEYYQDFFRYGVDRDPDRFKLRPIDIGLTSFGEEENIDPRSGNSNSDI